ncbi:TSUP family transporter [Nonomuraea insulae]|uniref:Probable membrane transporter protein n=1 Tax=Nonomuraea insulae TaxID=1616787 RepID=A0ABW1CU29_9ACTN
MHATLREFELLAHVMGNVGRVINRNEITRKVWHSTMPPPNNAIAVHIKRLRRRIGDDEKNPTNNCGQLSRTKPRTTTLYKVLAVLMVLMAAALVLTHTTAVGTLALPGPAQAIVGVVAEFGIGVVAAIMGVAGGELLIPTIVLLYSADIKSAGSLSLLVSLPTMLVAFARYSRDGSFAVLGANLRFITIMVAGSITGALLGGLLLGVIPDVVLIPVLAVILLISAVKMARHN